MKSDNKIIILGCGLSGMITALALARYGIPTTIIESQDISKKNKIDIRTTAINTHSKQFFEIIEIWKEIKNYVSIISDIYVVDNKAPEMLHFFLDKSENDKMGYIIENENFRHALWKCVENSNLISVVDNAEYNEIENKTSKPVLYLKNGRKYECDLVIACDGRFSFARNLFFSNLVEKSYKQIAITFIVKHEKPHEGTAVEHFMPTGPFAILPLVSQYHSSIVWTIDQNYSDTLLNLGISEFIYLIQDRFGEFLGKVELQSEVASYPLTAYITKKYYNKRVVLVADAAHVIHPLAGQGLNQGIKDIRVLVDMINKFGITDYSLLKYELNRSSKNILMFEITDAINKIFLDNSKIHSLFRQIGFKLINSSSFIKNKIIKYAMGGLDT